MMPRLTASCVFQGSCPVRPGRTNAAASSASAPGARGHCRRGSMPRGSGGGLLLGVTPLELLDAARGIDDLLLAGVVRVRFRGHLDLDHRVFLAVGPLHGLAALGVDRRARQEGMIRAGVEKDHRPVFGMDAWFHGASACGKGANYTVKAGRRASARGSGSPG